MCFYKWITNLCGLGLCEGQAMMAVEGQIKKRISQL